RNYGASIVLCTATQPAIEEHPEDQDRSFLGGLRNVRPIVPKDLRDLLFRELKRVQVNRHPDELDDEALAELLRQRERVLCIVNSRGHARAMFDRLRNEPGIRHLSTWMCAAHRAQVLAAIREDLAAGRPCRVVSTSLVEAGVDLDFPSVFRAEAGLDSIAQAAGRCNREGSRIPSESVVVVFRPKNWEPPAEVAQFASAMRSVFRQLGDGAEVLAPEAIEAYFRELYWPKLAGRDDDLDHHGIIDRMNERAGDFLFPFEWVEKAFRIIRDAQQPIIVPYDDRAREQLERLRHAERVGGIARKLQRYVVPVHRGIFLTLCAAGAVAPAREGIEGRQFYALVNDSLYHEEVGLRWDDPAFVRVEKLLM
ncbi:MAG: CRISPR-associated endonuclease Cas3'', partial [Rhodospirillales bacterium]|nr:CRISPR-associated endonuclease Cas3'' [Rhodospirillales bacterium]